MPFSDDVRGELAAIAPARDCDRLAELSALFHFAGRLHLLGRGEVSLHLDLATSARGPAGVRAAAVVRGQLGDPHLPAAGLRAGDPLPAPRRRRAARARRARAGGRASTRVTSPRERPPKRVVARACCRAAYLRGRAACGRLGHRAAFAAPRDSQRKPGRSRDARRRRGRRRRRAARRRRGATTRSRTRRASTDRRRAGRRRRERRRARAAGARRGRRARARANRLANADPANLVRTSRAAHAQLERSGDSNEPGGSTSSRRQLREIARAAPEASVALAPRARPKCNPAMSKATAHRRLRTLIRVQRYGH